MAVEKLSHTEIYAFRELAACDGELTGRPREMAAFQKRGIAEQCLSKQSPGTRAWRLTAKGRAMFAALDR